MSSPEQLEPGVFGIRKPVLLLPVGITERLTPVQFEAIVAHELTHARRHDNLAAAIHMVVETLFWFHPFVWWIEARLVEERERACDEEVLRMGSDPQDYAEGILSVVKFYLESPLACVSGVTGSNLKKRVEAIMINRNANNLSFGRKLLLVIAAMLALTGPFVIGVLRAPMTQAQTASAPKSGSVARAESLLPSSPRFEVASIRVSSPTEPHPGRLGAVQIETSPGRLTARNATMSELIKGAYTLEDYQVSGGPAWIANPGFDVEAKGPDGANRDQLLLRLRALLADRFELSVHWEPKELLVYALVVARGGAKLHPAKPFDATVPHGSRMHITDLRSLATYLSRLGSWPAQPGRPVIDKTGLTGDFDLDLDLSKVIAALPQSGVPTTNEGMYEATVNFVQEEFGLKLESQKAQVDVLVIDHVERPSEN
jgi:uncharacterized protein (TIGR03435 family)